VEGKEVLRVTLSKVFQVGCCCYQGFVASFSCMKSFVKMLKKSRIGVSKLIILGTGKSSRSFVTKQPDVRMFVDHSGATEGWWNMLMNSWGMRGEVFLLMS